MDTGFGPRVNFLNLLRPGLRRVRSKPVRSLLFMGGIVFGTALYSSLNVINQATNVSLDESVHSIAGETDLIVSSGPLGFSEKALEVVQQTPGVLSSVPLIQAHAYFTNHDGISETLTVLGVDLLNEQAVRSYGESGERIVRDPLVFMSQADSLALTPSFAKKQGIELGSKINLVTVRGLKLFTVRALIDAKGPSQAFGGALGVMDIEAARQAFGKAGLVDQIDIKVVDRKEVTLVAERLRQSLARPFGQELTVAPPSEEAENFKRTVSSFQSMTSFFSGMVFLIAFILVVSAVTHSISERRREISILRAMGGTQTQIFFILLAEILVLAGVGAAIGVFVSEFMSSAMAHSVQQSLVRQFAVSVDLSHLHASWAQRLRFFLVGVFVSFAAALGPSYRAAMAPPVESIRRSGEALKSQRALYKPFIYGLCLFVLLIGSTAFKLAARFPSAGVLEPLVGIMASLLVGPWITLKFISGFHPAACWFKSPALLSAWDTCARGQRRTQVIIFSLLMGLVLLVITSIVLESFTAAFEVKSAQVASPDIFISSSGSLTSNQLQPLDYELRKQMETIAGIGKVFGQRIIKSRFEGETINIRAIDEIPPTGFVVPYSYIDIVDRPVAVAGQEMYHDAGLSVGVSEAFVQKFHKKTGDKIALSTPSGKQEAKIVGVISDFFASGGTVYMSLEKYRFYWHDSLVSGFGIFLPANVDAQEIREEFSRRFSKLGLVATSRAEVKAESKLAIEKSFAFLKIIQWMIAGVALLSFLNTLLIETTARTKEIGILRAIGMTRSELVLSLLFEAQIIGFFTTGVSIALGTFVAYLFIHFDLGPQFGWVIPFTFDPQNAFVAVGLGCGLALVASVYPAYRAARIEIRDAVTDEA